MLLTCSSIPAVEWHTLPTPALPHWRAGVAVCRVSISENLPHVPQLLARLPETEQQRARRFHAAADYHRFIIGRAAQRLLLGQCLGQPPGSLRFEAGPNEKPVLANAPDLHYNASHAGNWVLLAIGPVAVGVDVEQLTPAFPFQELLDHSFSQAEKKFIIQQPSPVAAFYQLWTRKEAFVKATAQGIDQDFGQVPALDGPHQWAARHPSPVARWVVRSFTPAKGYVAAVAHPAAASTLTLYEVPIGL